MDQVVGAAGQLAQHRGTGRAAAHQDARRGRARRSLEQAHQLLDLPIRTGQIAGGVADDQRSELPARLPGVTPRRACEKEPPGHGVPEGQVVFAVVRQLPRELRVPGIDQQRCPGRELSQGLHDGRRQPVEDQAGDAQQGIGRRGGVGIRGSIGAEDALAEQARRVVEFSPLTAIGLRGPRLPRQQEGRTGPRAGRLPRELARATLLQER